MAFPFPSGAGPAAVLTLAGALLAAVPASGADPSAVDPSAAAADSLPPFVVEVAPGSDWNELQLRRAVSLWWTDDTAAAVDRLWEREDGVADARADFLLTWGLHVLGDRQGFRSAASGLEGSVSPYAAWISRLELVDASRELADSIAVPAPVDAEAALVAAELLLRRDRADEATRRLRRTTAEGSADIVRRALLARAEEQSGADPADELRRLAEHDPVNALEEAIVAGARIRLSTLALEAGESERSEELLAGVPSGSALGSRARHVLGRAALEQGDAERGATVLRELLDDQPGYRNRREVARALGFAALAEERWEEAHGILLPAEGDWIADRDEIDRLETAAEAGSFARVWRAWTDEGEGAGTLVLDRTRLDEALSDVARRALDLTRNDEGAPAWSGSWRPSGEQSLPRAVHPPSRSERRTHDELENELAAARTALHGDRHALAQEQARGIRRAEYLGRGLTKANAEVDSLLAASARLQALLARTEEITTALALCRDEEIRRIAHRTHAFLDVAETNLVHAQYLVRFHLEGPGRARPELLPAGVPSPREILVEEQKLVRALERWFDTFAQLAPELVRRSHDEIWLPRATKGLSQLAAAAAAQTDRARGVHAEIDSTRIASLDPVALAGLRERVEFSESVVGDLDERVAGSRRELVLRALARARDEHAKEGEGIAYGLAVAAHETGSRIEANARYESFLAVWPLATARSEIRFRLADARMAKAREEFQAQMASFLGDDPVSDDLDRKALAPFVEYGPALEQYLKILEEDPTYAHRDAVLFHAGMILSDDGDPTALGHLTELVEGFSDSPYAQEAHLRLGDELFLAKDFRACLPHFQSAAAGHDPEHAAIALYKAGWALYNLDRFDDAADSFHRLLGLYESRPEAARTTDLRHEAEEYMVHALARAGGEEAFRRLFEHAGISPHEETALTSLGHLLRRFSLFEEATAADSLWLERYGTRPGALDAAERLLTTLDRADEPEAARRARLQYAPRFLPGSEWHQANESDSLRIAGAAFARGAYKKVALHHHHAAREDGEASDWNAALDLYETMIARFPEHGETATSHYYAGEAAAALERHERAIAHFESAAASDSASFRTDAAWQAVAVRDTWYESTRTAPDSAGADSLARALLGAIDDFVATGPVDERTGDLLWRKGHLAYEHGWTAEAARGFSTFAQARPTDPRALDAARLHGQVLYEADDFAAAAAAYSGALSHAHATGADSVAAELAPLIPHCRFREAEVAARDGSDAEAARLFERVADVHPGFEHADQSLYRAGLAYQKARAGADAVRAWTALTDRYPEAEYVRDAHLEIADTWEREKRPAAAARALERFATAFPEDEDTSAALLRAIDLYGGANDPIAAEGLKTRYLEEFPEDTSTVIAILEERAERELATLGPGASISILLAPAAAAKATPASNLSRYLELAKTHGDETSRALLAEVDFRRGEEARASYDRARLTQPLASSIAEKKVLLEKVLEQYKACAGQGVAPWNRAAAFRIGECLVGFGDALLESERPGGLSEDDLWAYEEVLDEQSWEFFDKGEEAWAQLLRQSDRSAKGDEWLEQARTNLWPRIAQRFVHRPEVEYPLIAASPPEEDR